MNGLLWRPFGLILAAGMIAGCSGPSAENRVASLNASNIQRVANLYMAYQKLHNWTGPADEATFKQFIQNEFPKEKLALMQVDPAGVDALFISDRDGKPYTIRYSVGGGPGQKTPVAFEQEGVNGKRQVASTGGLVEEVDEARYQQLLEGKSA